MGRAKKSGKSRPRRGAKQLSTDREIASLKSAARPYEVSVSGARGLLLRIFPNGERVFEVRYVAPNGKRRRLALGPYPGLRLAQAREKAGKARVHVADGADPAAQLQAAKLNARTGETVTDLSNAYFKAAAVGLHGGRRKPKKPSTIAHERSMFGHHIAPKLGARRFTEIKRADVRTFMRELVTAEDLSPASITRIGQTLSGIFGLAVYDGRMDFNPCQGESSPLKAAKRERRFDDDELKAIWNTLVINSVPREGKAHPDDIASRLEPTTALALRFTILTLCRRGEAAGARWPEIDRKAKLWEIPSTRNKSARPHVVPLSEEALAVLDAAAKLPGASKDFIFPAPDVAKSCIDPKRLTRATSRLCARLEIKARSVHDFRRTGGTILAARYGVSGFVIGRVLGHAVHDGAAVTSIYNRHDYLPEKRRALDSWAAHIVALAEGRELATNIVEFPAGKIA